MTKIRQIYSRNNENQISRRRKLSKIFMKQWQRKIMINVKTDKYVM